MDRSAVFQKLKDQKKTLIGMLGTFALGAGVMGAYFKISHSGSHSTTAHTEGATHPQEGSSKDHHSDPHAKASSHGESHAKGSHPSLLAKAFGPVGEVWQSIQKKAEIIENAENENLKLKLENVNLKLQNESLQFECRTKASSTHTSEMEFNLHEQTGAVVGRTLAGIHYRPPTHMLPPQLYTLGVSYLKAGEDEKAAVIFSFLTDLEENDVYKTAKNYLLTGVAWYRLDNFSLADDYFNRVLKLEANSENLQYQAQARLWKGLVAQRLTKHNDSQNWLRELIDHHPHSTEAAWVNPQPASARKPASKTKEDRSEQKAEHGLESEHSSDHAPAPEKHEGGHGH